MWIYIPSTFYPSAPVLVDLNSASNSQFQTLASSVMWRAKRMRPQFWRNAWKKTPWIARLFGRIYEPLTANLGLEKWIASLGDIRANLSLLPEKDLPIKTHAICGQLLLPSFGKLDLPSVSLKMSEDIYLLDLKKSQMTYNEWDTRLKQACLARRKSVLHTIESAFSYWPTATTMDAGAAETITPNDRYYATKNGNVRRHSKTGWSRSLGLARTSRLWPTILTSANCGASAPEIANGNAKKRLMNEVSIWEHSHQHLAIPSDGNLSQTILNPLFCEWLMGWPIGWTGLEPVGTELFRWLQLMHGELLRLTLN